MKLFVVFAVFGFLGAALGAIEGGDLGDSPNEGGGATSPDNCLYRPENEQERLISPGYTDMAAQCLSIDKTGLELDNLTTIEDFQQQARQYCLKVQDMRNCLVNVSKLSASCQNQTQHQGIQIFIDMLNSAVEFICREDGSSLSVIIYGMRNDPPRENVFGSCLHLLDYKVMSASKPDLEPPAKILMFYRHLDLAKECFKNRIQEEELKNVIESFIDDIRSKIKCIHPENHTPVVCSTIDNN